MIDASRTRNEAGAGRWLFGFVTVLMVTFSSAFSADTGVALAASGAADGKLSGNEVADALTVGAASIDVTPDMPIRLCGYAARHDEAKTIETRLNARALAIGDATGKPAAVLVSLDATAVSSTLSDDVAGRLKEKAGLPRERFVLSCTHSHCAPCQTGVLVNLFGQPIPPDQQARIDRYTRSLQDKLVAVALSALADLKPGTLSVARGRVGFAANRRTPGGPVDQEVAVLIARSESGALRAVVSNYACHCTTLGPEQRVNAEWAGYANGEIEKEHPGAIAMVTIGCGADSNPAPRGKLELARQHGNELAVEVNRLLKVGPFKPVRGVPLARMEHFDLAYDKLPSKDEWEALAKRTDAIGYNARTQLARLAAGQAIPTSLPYRTQSLVFGDDLAMVFLAGEVVVDYVLRLKQDFDPEQLWVTAYSNDVPCYIPSRRVLSEGGYEAGGAMVYYGRPGPLAPSVENDIVRSVHKIVPQSFRTQQSLIEFPPPRSVQDSIDSLHLPKGLTVQAVAVEPLVTSPVAIDFDTRGRLWVLEMNDYPSGLHDDGTPGGRVKVLTDTNHDGRYDKAEVFLDHLPFPQGLMCWRNGVLVCAAPDILYAEDADGDGVATGEKDIRKTLFSGFSPDNQQWEVNGLAWGLDNWIYGASSIHNAPIQVRKSGQTIELGGRDFRMNPDTSAFEPASGRTQFGRVRDDWGNWFGNDNSTPLWHYPFPDRYARRNPHVPLPAPRVAVAAGAEPTRLYPVSRLLERFNQPAGANQVTSACGSSIYRDVLLGKDPDDLSYEGNAFYCEPVHNLVQRLVLTPKGLTFEGRRAPGNVSSEFLASTDNWFRPVQTRTGPDGALWVVDMHRFVIEHPRWITPERKARLDTRAGADMGRIYRVFPATSPPRPIVAVADLPAAELVAKLDDPNGTFRDLIHRELFQRQDPSAVKPMQTLAASAVNPAVQVQALSLLDGLSAASTPRALPADLLLRAMRSPSPHVRRVALQLGEKRFAGEPELAGAALRLTADPDLTVRYQLAMSLGEWDDARVSKALAEIIATAPEDAYLRAAVLSSAGQRAGEALEIIPGHLPAGAVRNDVTRQLAVTRAATATNAEQRISAWRAVTPEAGAEVEPWQFEAVGDLLAVGDSKSAGPSQQSPAKQAAAADPPGANEVAERLKRVMTAAERAAADQDAGEPTRVLAVELLSRDGASSASADIAALLAGLIRAAEPPAVQQAAIAALARQDERALDLLLDAWPKVSLTCRPRLFDALASRKGGAERLLAAIEQGKVAVADLSAAERLRLTKFDDESVKARAAKLFASVTLPSRAEAVAKSAPALKLAGRPAAGAAVFAKTCSACHQLNGVGHAVGPNLGTVTDRSGQALLTAIVDPNAAVEGRFTAYLVHTKDDRDLTGLLADETASGFTVLQGGGLRETLSRSDVTKVASSGASLMPEGLETGLSHQELADVIAYVQSNETGRTLAELLLADGSTPEQKREALERRPDLAVEAVRVMSSELEANSSRTDVCLQGIWQASLSVGKRGDGDDIRRLLALALPLPGQPLSEWQAVSLGGGLVNGISQTRDWPAEPIVEAARGESGLEERWRLAVTSASALAVDPAVRRGTRYDALRLTAMGGWDLASPTILRYLADGAAPELQQGATSGLVDIHDPRAADAIIEGWSKLTPKCRGLAFRGLMRDDWIERLVAALRDGRIPIESLTDEQESQLLQIKNDKVREQVESLSTAKHR